MTAPKTQGEGCLRYLKNGFVKDGHIKIARITPSLKKATMQFWCVCPYFGAPIIRVLHYEEAVKYLHYIYADYLYKKAGL